MEQLPATPDAAHQIYADRLPLAERYVQHLATTGVEWGLIGPREVPRLWDRHVLNCAVVQELVAPDQTVADVGSGAGLPGIALALCRPDLRLVLIEPLLRRADWLTMVVDDLRLSSVRVLRGRAEEVGPSLSVPVVTARAVAPLDRLARWSMPLLVPGGRLLAIKGRTAAEEVERTRAAVGQAGGDRCEVRTVGAELLAEPVTVVEVHRAADRAVARRPRR